MKRLFLSLAGASPMGVALTAHAQAPAIPSNQAASALQTRYVSAFAHYTPCRDVKCGDWKALNAALVDTGDGAMAMPMPPQAMPMATPSDHASTPQSSDPKPAPSMPDHVGHPMPMQGDKK